MDRRRTYHTSSRHEGFTLVELLVVVSIIGLLVSLLLPALGKSRLAATLLLGKSDMGGIGKAIHNYAADNKAWCPTVAPKAGGNYVMLDPGGTYYNKRAVAGWTIWDVSAAYPGSGLPDGIGPTGLGLLVARSASQGSSLLHPADGAYLADPKVFFHPVMRNEGVLGGTARHWFNVRNNWGKFRGDTSIVTTGYLGGSNSWTVAGGGLINTTIIYRGGDWTPNGDGTNYNSTAYAGGAGYDRFEQMRTDIGNFNSRILLTNNLFEQQIYRMGGNIDYMTGDGAVRNTTVSNGTHSEFWNPGPAALGNNTGVNAINSPTPNLNHPTGGNNSPGIGQLGPYVAYKIEKEDLALY